MKAIGRMGVHKVFGGMEDGMPVSVITMGENLAINVSQYIVSERGHFRFKAALYDFHREESLSDVAMRAASHSRWVQSSSLSWLRPG